MAVCERCKKCKKVLFQLPLKYIGPFQSPHLVCEKCSDELMQAYDSKQTGEELTKNSKATPELRKIDTAEDGDVDGFIEAIKKTAMISDNEAHLPAYMWEYVCDWIREHFYDYIDKEQYNKLENDYKALKAENKAIFEEYEKLRNKCELLSNENARLIKHNVIKNNSTVADDIQHLRTIKATVECIFGRKIDIGE